MDAAALERVANGIAKGVRDVENHKAEEPKHEPQNHADWPRASAFISPRCLLQPHGEMIIGPCGGGEDAEADGTFGDLAPRLAEDIG